MTTWQLPDDYLTTVWWLPENCLTTFWQLPDDCLTTAWWLPNNCPTTAWQLPGDCFLRSVHLNKTIPCGQPISSLSSWHCFWPSHLNKMEIQSPFSHWNSFVFDPKNIWKNSILFQKLFWPKKTFEFSKFLNRIFLLKAFTDLIKEVLTSLTRLD